MDNRLKVNICPASSVISEKSYDSIAVKEIPDRANVGRSTFYTHYRDKDALLVSGIHEMLHSVHSAGPPASAKGHEKILWFSLPIFEYHDRHRRRSDAPMGTKGRAILHGHPRNVLAGLIGDEVKNNHRHRRNTTGETPPDLLMQYVASTFILVLNWWLESRSPLPPKEVNDVFRSQVPPALTAASNNEESKFR
jgi:AcrR family transcriptional regulator